ATSTTDTYTLSLHDALPILTKESAEPFARYGRAGLGINVMSLHAGTDGADSALLGFQHNLIDSFQFRRDFTNGQNPSQVAKSRRSEEHTSELQSPYDLVCRL